MINHSLTDTAVNTNLSPKFITALTQSCQDQMARPQASFTANLQEIAYIAFIASEQGHYQHSESRQLYHELAADGFQVPANHVSEFTKKLAICLDIAIENIRRLNQGKILRHHYQNNAFRAISTLLGHYASRPVTAELNNQLVRDLEGALRIDPTPTQHLADQFIKLHKDFYPHLETDQPAFTKPLTELVNEGSQLCSKASDYTIHHQQFTYYGTLSYFERWMMPEALCYGLARMVELVANTPDTAQRRDFFAHLEAILGKPVNLPTQQAA